jgi:hypothetical protein
LASAQNLPWNFEAFRRYVVYRRMQQAAAVLSMYEGQELSSGNPRMEELLEDLRVRTGEEWLPQRSGSESVRFNLEGDFYRNKGRLLTSLYVLQPKQLVKSGTPTITLTEFGRALGTGYVSEEEYYRFIVTRYEFPHPAYDENWAAWTAAKKRLKPLVYVLQVLMELYKLDEDQAYVNSQELATFGYETASHNKTPGVAQAILKGRKTGGQKRKYSDEVNRKINDMLGFLSLAGYVFYNGDSVDLNLMGVHPEELAYYWLKRKTRDYEEANRWEELKKLVDGALRGLP